MSYDLTKFKKAVEELNIALTEEQYKQYVMYYEMLVEKNKVMNLTGITEFEDVMLKHFVDSLAIVKVMDMSKVSSLIDVGTGAGFPGVPIKIAFPHIDVVLLDSLNKRLLFLDEVINALGLENIKTVHGRSEDIGKNINYREKFDLCTSRAVANMSVLSELCIPFIKVDGVFMAYKAGGSDEELNDAGNAIRILGGKIDNIYKMNLPDSDIERIFAKIVKIKDTPKKFPRKAGTPSKEPLK
ncbi:MAG: 16S rRNA (guanine(527)-N(7))-methyltransferase RsmG [Lachnospiraceae bacterium]|nr:16S rRNA (guanine(527)-N(7))-methyltransferase RsmG [Lachnospiraceae bacterium]